MESLQKIIIFAVRKGAYMPFLFYCLVPNEGATCVKPHCNLRQNTLWFALNCKVICLELQTDIPWIATKFAWKGILTRLYIACLVNCSTLVLYSFFTIFNIGLIWFLAYKNKQFQWECQEKINGKSIHIRWIYSLWHLISEPYRNKQVHKGTSFMHLFVVFVTPLGFKPKTFRTFSDLIQLIKKCTKELPSCTCLLFLWLRWDSNPRPSELFLTSFS